MPEAPGDDRCEDALSGFRRTAPRSSENTVFLCLTCTAEYASVDGAIWCTCTYDNAIAVLEKGQPSLALPAGLPG